MLNPFHLRPYIGHEVRLETVGSIVRGTLTDVDRRSVQLIDVADGWQRYADMTVGLSSIVSVASERHPHPLELVTGIGLGRLIHAAGMGPFESLRNRLAPLAADLPRIIGRDNLMIEAYAFSVRCGRVIVVEGEAFTVDELVREIESFYIAAETTTGWGDESASP